MKYVADFDILEFEFWGRAMGMVYNLTNEQMRKLEQHIISFFEGETPTNEDINTFVWLGCEDFFEAIEKEDEE